MGRVGVRGGKNNGVMRFFLGGIVDFGTVYVDSLDVYAFLIPVCSVFFAGKER